MRRDYIPFSIALTIKENIYLFWGKKSRLKPPLNLLVVINRRDFLSRGGVKSHSTTGHIIMLIMNKLIQCRIPIQD